MKKFNLLKNIKKLKRLFIFSSLCFYIVANNIENERKYFELERRQKELENENFTKDEKPYEYQPLKNDLTTYYIEKIIIVDEYSLLKNKAVMTIIKDYEGKYLTRSQIKEVLFILKVISDGFKSRGLL